MGQSESGPDIASLLEAVSRGLLLLSGIQLDVFTPLSAGPLTAAELATKLDVDAGKLRRVLNALVQIGVLQKDGRSYANSKESEVLLVRDKPEYVGGDHGFLSELWRALLQTSYSMRTGRPQAKVDYSAGDQARLESFLRGISLGAAVLGRYLSEAYDLSDCRTLLDAGAGSAGVSIGLTEACPHIEATAVDLPNIAPITERLVAEANASGRVRVKALDLVHDPLEDNFDIAVAQAVITTIAPEEGRLLLRNISQSMNPGGRIFLDNPMLPSAFALDVSYISLYEAGQAYTEDEQRELLTDAGFVNISRDQTRKRLMVAEKPSWAWT